MTDVGFAVSLDVDLSLEADDKEPCMIKECDCEAVMEGLTTVPCECPQILCLQHYEIQHPLWVPGDTIWCYLCRWNGTPSGAGEFIGWEKL